MIHIALDFPEKKLGEWSIQTFYENDIKYQKLLKGDFVMMLNTPNIVKDFENFLVRAEGSILINGLGMGMCCQYLLEKDTVTDLTVIEFEKNIVDLISPLFAKDSRCTIIHGDAYTYEPPKGKTYDYVWHDIWTYRSSKNVKEIETLFNKYKEITKWQDAYAREFCIELRQKERKAGLDV